MKLYFLRHASASDFAPSDAARPLTSEGKDEARSAGAALAELGVAPGQILTSPLLRARQTAELAAKALDFEGAIVPVEVLKNDATTAELLSALKPYANAGEVLLVGHMPSLAEHIAALIGAGNSAGLPLGKGAIACVEIDHLRTGAGHLRWLMRQKQLQKISR